MIMIKKLINCSNKNGLNTALVSCKGGKMISLQFLLSHDLFDANSIFSRDKNDLNAIHYSCFTDSISICSTILTLYKENEDTNFSELMFIRDKLGNIPVDYVIRKNPILNNCTLFKWIIKNCFNDIKDDPVGMKRRRVEMLFGNINYSKEVSLIEIMFRQNDMLITQCIKEYFDEIEIISDYDIEIVGHILMYLYNSNWTLSKYIINKVNDDSQLCKILSVENSDKYNLLIYVCKDSSIDIINWLINIIPRDHPSLLSKESVYGKTALIYLIERALLNSAENLLNKISNQSLRLQLIQVKDYDKSILDDANQQNIPNRINWVQMQMNQK